LVSSVTSQTFGGYLLETGTQLNKQQSTTTKVSVGQSWKATGATPHLGRVDDGAKMTGTLSVISRLARRLLVRPPEPYPSSD